MANQTPDTLQPHNVDAEEGLLGSLLIDSDAIMRVATFIDEKDFFIERNGWIFKAIKDLHEKGVPSDNITLSNELERRGQLMEVGGPAYLTSLINATPTSIHAEFYGRIIEQKALPRRLIDVAGKITRMAYEDQNDPDELHSRAMELIRQARGDRSNGGLKHFGEALRQQCDRADDIATNGLPVGVKSGLIDYDKKMGGFQRSDMITLIARPGLGKTSFAITCGLNAAKMGYNVAIFTMEMSSGQLAQRILSMETELDMTKIRQGELTGDELALLDVASSDLAQLPVYIDDTPAITLAYLRAEAMRIHSEVGIDLIIIDYLQLMTGDGFNRQEEVSKISKGIKQLAKELNIPIMPCAQINRQVESRADKRPQLADIRESGSIEQDSDVVIGLYRDEVYNEDTEFPNIAEAIILKHRNGPTGKVNLFFKKQTTKFTDLVIEPNKLDY